MGKFSIQRYLGEGSCGIVLKCQDITNGKLFTVKQFTRLGRKDRDLALEFKLLKVLHRDINPGNLLVSGSGVVKVAVWALLDKKWQKLTLRVGMRWYVSPEVLTGDHFYSNSRDSRVRAAARIPPTDPQLKYQLCDPLLSRLACLQMDPDSRATCSELLGHQYFSCDSFHQRFSEELEEMVHVDQHGELKELDKAGPHEASCSPDIPREISPGIPS
ncbi:unnamed protein product [Merluccius merluccius]